MISEQLETEQYLIASLLAHPDNLYRHTIEPEQLEHLGIYLTAIKDVFASTGKTNPVTVADRIATLSQGSSASDWRQNLIEYMAGYVSHDAGGYVDWLVNTHRVRQIAETCRAISLKAMHNGAQADDLYAMMGEQVAEGNQLGVYQRQGEVLDHWVKSQITLTATPTGLVMLDSALEGGMQDGNVYGLAGYAKAGKTMLAGTISGNMAAKGIKHLYVAMEMGAGAIESRVVARRLGITNRSLKNQIKLGHSPIKADMVNNVTHYLNAPGITWSELKQQMTIALHRDGIKRFIIDYWQLLANDTRKDDHQYWADAAQGISDFCKRYNAACILVAQLNDDGKTLGSRGLVRACDMLLNIEFCKDQPNMRWLSMRATRETEQADLGSETNPYLEIDKNGPYMRELQLLNI